MREDTEILQRFYPPEFVPSAPTDFAFGQNESSQP